MSRAGRARDPALDGPEWAPWRRLARVLDRLPSGYPATRDGLELRLLRKIFDAGEAELAAALRTTGETAVDIAARTGRPEAGLASTLDRMWGRGQIEAEGRGDARTYRLLPFIIGIYEYQLDRMDRELAELFEGYAPVWGGMFMQHEPPLFLVVPAEHAPGDHHHHALPYHRVEAILEAGQSFAVKRCVCRTEKQLVGKGCDHAMETCLAIGHTPDAFTESPFSGRTLSREEARALLRAAEASGLVHNVHNVAAGHTFVCNCCRCCCGQVVAARRYGLASRTFNTHYRAEIDPDACSGCGLCTDERCPVDAIEAADEGFRVVAKRCLGCGLCATTCPEDAIALRLRDATERRAVPADERDWMDQRAANRGIDYDDHR